MWITRVHMSPSFAYSCATKPVLRINPPNTIYSTQKFAPIFENDMDELTATSPTNINQR